MTVFLGPPEVKCHFEDLIININQSNLETISLFAQSVYSCKNVFQRGQKRKLVKKLLASSEEPGPVLQNTSLED
jgi:hypothetical protein